MAAQVTAKVVNPEMNRYLIVIVASAALALLGGNTVPTDGIAWTLLGEIMILFSGIGLGLVAPPDVHSIILGGEV